MKHHIKPFCLASLLKEEGGVLIRVELD